MGRAICRNIYFLFANKIIIGNIYRPPNELVANYNRFTEEFVQILMHLHKSKSEVIIIGDFNIDLLKINSKLNSKVNSMIP